MTIPFPELDRLSSPVTDHSRATAKPPSQPWLNWSRGNIVAIVVAAATVTLVLVVAILKYVERAEPAPESTPAVALKMDELTDGQLGTLSQHAYELIIIDVRDALKAPSTARFADEFNYTSYPIRGENKRSFTIEAWVESQNTFGVMLRDDLEAILTYDADANSWDYFSLRIGDSYLKADPALIELSRLSADCRETDRFTGRGDRTTKAFTIYSEWWRFNLHVPGDQRWNLEGPAPTATAEVVDSLGRVVATSEEVARGGDWLKVVDERGTFTMRVNSVNNCQWEIVIQEPF